VVSLVRQGGADPGLDPLVPPTAARAPGLEHDERLPRPLSGWWRIIQGGSPDLAQGGADPGLDPLIALAKLEHLAREHDLRIVPAAVTARSFPSFSAETARFAVSAISRALPGRQNSVLSGDIIIWLSAAETWQSAIKSRARIQHLTVGWTTLKSVACVKASLS
jgi:hypothetical protein